LAISFSVWHQSDAVCVCVCVCVSVFMCGATLCIESVNMSIFAFDKISASRPVSIGSVQQKIQTTTALGPCQVRHQEPGNRRRVATYSLPTSTRWQYGKRGWWREGGSPQRNLAAFSTFIFYL